jgi:hypothetical protein
LEELELMALVAGVVVVEQAWAHQVQVVAVLVLL